MSTSARSKRIAAGMLGAALIGAFVWIAVGHRPASAAARHGPATVAVRIAVVKRMNVPVFLQGLGSVQAYYTANVTAQTDGELTSVDFTEGQMVRKGQLLAQIDPRPAQALLAGAMANRAKDMAQLSGAQATLAQYEQLAPQNLASKQALNSQRALVAQFKAQVQADEAAIDNAKIQLAYTRITSPIAGRTGILMIDPGNVVHATSTNPIVVVTQVQPIAVLFTLPEEDLEEVRQAMAAGTIPVTAIARDAAGEQLDQGKVALVDNQIDTTTGTMRLKAIFPNVHNKLWPGQFVNARMLLRTEHGALVVPNVALQRGPEGLFTYVVTPQSTVRVQPLTIDEGANGLSGMTVVDSGLKPGERVVISNQLRLQPGSHVSVIPNPSEAAAAGSPKARGSS